MELREAIYLIRSKFQDDTTRISEPAVAYGAFVDPISDFHIPIVAEKGVDPIIADFISSSLGLSQKQIAAMLHLSDRSYRNHLKNNDPFVGLKAEMIVTLINVIQEGISTFEDLAPFRKWLYLELEVLQFKRPMDFLHTISGSRYIIQNLRTIQAGAFA